MNKQLSNKTIIITGANAGIGYEAALELAKRDAHIIMACRSEAKAKEAAEKIKAESKNDKVEVELLDLASLKSVREFAQRINSKLTRLDILINNAGLSTVPFTKTEDGYELIFQANYLGHFLLTNLLIDLIKSSAPSRIINVSSSAHTMIKTLDFDDLQSEKKYSSFDAYSKSKIENVLFTVELAKRLKDTGVSVVSLHPGFVNTEIFRPRDGNSFIDRTALSIFRVIASFVAKNTKDGAATTIYCATSDDIPKLSGSYFENSRLSAATSAATNSETAEKLWTVSAKLAGLE